MTKNSSCGFIAFVNAMLAAITKVAVRRHAAARVDDETDGNWGVLIVEKADLLRPPVLEHAKRILAETADIAAPFVLYCDVQHHELGLR